MNSTRSLILPAPEGFEVLVEHARLVVEEGSGVGEVFELRGREMILGRDEGADVVLADPAASRRHARFEFRAGTWWIEDLDSKAGTRVDGAQVGRVELLDGAQVQVGSSALRFRVEVERQKVPSRDEQLGVLVSQSTVMKRVFGLVRRVAPMDLPVLIQGESGTGKEGLAKALHDHSTRAAGSFQVVDCTLLDREHLRSELFGHVRGAFTGATSDRPGAFRLCHEGTLFLDEIGELPLDLQPTLLRVLETGQVQPLGGSSPVQVEVRVVAATHRDLVAMVEAGEFREDLYYRLAAILIPVPPLRDRQGDASHLAARFLPAGKILDPACRELLDAHDWPGNVRQLRNAIRRGAAMAEGALVHPDDLMLGPGRLAPAPASAGAPVPPAPEGLTRVEAAEREGILEALECHRWSRSDAAASLGISRVTLWRRMKKYGLD